MFDDGAPDPFRERREEMVEEQLVRRGIHDASVLQAMRDVPRHLFVPEALRGEAYEDHPVVIGHGQTISQPYMVAKMVELLDLSREDRVLDIGTGSGYQAAVLSRIVKEVWSVEIVPELADSARKVLSHLGCHGVHVVTGDGSIGLPEQGPFDGIVVAAGAPSVPEIMLVQLREGGRLVIPVGDRESQALRVLTRTRQGVMTRSVLSCCFVPLVGREGWPAPEALH